MPLKAKGSGNYATM